jgi:type IV pilus assembly protein PilB
MSDKLIEVAVNGGLMTRDQLKQAREAQKSVPGDLAAIALKLRMVDETELANLAAKHLKLKRISTTDLVIPSELADLIPMELLTKHMVLPIGKSNNKLILATADPYDYEVLDTLQFHTSGMETELRVATFREMSKAIGHYFRGEKSKEIEQAEKKMHAPAEAPKPSGSGSSPATVPGLGLHETQQLLRAIVELMIEKKIFTRDELKKHLK